MKSLDLPNGELAQELAGHLDFVQRMARALVRDEQVAEDVVQETMLAAIARRPDPEAGLRVWLISVLRRRVLLHFRTEQRRVARETLRLQETRADQISGKGEAERAMESLERTSMLGKAVALLEDPYRTVVVLRYLEGIAPQEIAKRLDRSVHTVNTQLQRGLLKLRQHLDAGSQGGRREWVLALMPHALAGPHGWWPASVGGVLGVAYGTIAQVAVLMFGLLIGLRALVSGEPAEGHGGASEPPIELAAAPAEPEESGLGAVADAAKPLATGDSTTPTPKDPPPQSDTAQRDTKAPHPPGTVRFVVRFKGKPLVGARVVAVRFPNSEPPLQPVTSTVRGADGYSARLASRMFIPPSPPEDMTADNRKFRATGSDGVVELPILDGEPWKVRVTAEGYAREMLDVQGQSPTMERGVELLPSGHLILQRGTFPLEYKIYAQITSPFGGRVRVMILDAGKQEIEVRDVHPGHSHLEAMSQSAAEVGHWFTKIDVAPDQITRVDLSRAGRAHLQIDIRGVDPAAPPRFAQIQGPDLESGQLPWIQFAAVNDGLADFHGLPPGPAVVRIISRGAELARLPFEVLPGSETQRVEVKIADGKIRVLHGELNSTELSWSLALRSDSRSSKNGWISLGEPFPGKGESMFHGMVPGEYRLWVIHGSEVRRWDLTFDGSPLEIDVLGEASKESSPVGGLRLVAGPGVKANAKVALELTPGRWSPLPSGEATVQLSHGAYRIRWPLEGIGFAVQEVQIPRDDSVTFTEHASPQSVEIQCANPDGGKLEFRITSVDAQDIQEPNRYKPLWIGPDGTGSVQLRPGRYAVTGRTGRSVPLQIRAGQTSASLFFD